ncbi:MAG: 2-keto-4-pentenoate hydratase [Robiginitomaculum sp.]|nr:MAG: 2-keto-4-pentenoate hydratase [Robiginitomaculum sp.]
MYSHDELASQLRQAYVEGAIPPLRDGLDPTDAESAYAVQSINTKFWQAQGRRIVGKKIGLTAKAVQAQLGVNQPDYGVLFDDMMIEDGGVLMSSKVMQPKAEAEIALVLKKGIDNPNASFADVMAATDYVLPAIEIVDSRIADWKISFADTVADNGSSAFFVLGNTPHSLDGLDLKTCGMVLEVNGEVESLGAGAACLGHPVNAAAWLARNMARAGQPLEAGDIVLTGALGPMVTLSVGDVVSTTIGGLGSCGFTYIHDKKG